jgi:pimeloyl-ACP methyl ester carboxylesterase
MMQSSGEEDATDLAILIEQLDLAPAHVVGISFGGATALRLAARRPDLVHCFNVHEPPLFDLVADDPEHGPTMLEVRSRRAAVTARLAAVDDRGGTRKFMETIAFEPGVWEGIPPEGQQVLINNAPTFLDEMSDPAAWPLDLTALATAPCPILFTYGDQSQASFPPVAVRLAATVPSARLRVFAGAGHVPVDTQPAEYVAAVTAFATSIDVGTS